VRLAMLLRQNTIMTVCWIADRLQMGRPGMYRICCIGKAKRSRNRKEGNRSINTKVRPLRDLNLRMIILDGGLTEELKWSKLGKAL